jgi:hypothetical protein
MEEKASALLLRDYGGIGVLVVIVLTAAWKMWSEQKQVRQDSDERAKKLQDQLLDLMNRSSADSKEHAKIFADATIRQSEIFAAATRESTQALRELVGRLLDLSDPP